MIHYHHCRKDIGHQVVLFIEHIRLDDDRGAAIVRDAACDADRLSRLGCTDEIHRHRDCHDRGTDGGRGDARDRVGERYQYAPVQASSVVVVLQRIRLQADGRTAAMDVRDLYMEIVTHEMVFRINV